MNRIWTFIKKHPLHLVLLPFFFILEQWLRYKGMLDQKETIAAFFIIQGITLAAFFILNLFIRNKLKAGIIVTVFGFMYLYFGSIKISLSNISFFTIISHYKTLIPVLFIFSILFVYKIIKTKRSLIFNLFLNSLFAAYILLEIIKIPFSNKANIELATDNMTPVKDKLSIKIQPNIYYLLFDCYPSSVYQQEVLGSTNNFLDSLLTENHFFVVQNSASNYSNTAFSMASTFGMNYLEGVDTTAQMSPVLYNKAMHIVNSAPLFPLLKKAGYNFINLSIFDFAGKPAFKKEKFLSITTTQIIFYFTFFDCIRRDLFWQLFPKLHERSLQKEKNYLQKLLGPNKKHNRQLSDKLSDSTFSKDSDNPFFLYAHFEMPHFPYFYDASGKEYPEDSIFTDSMITDRKKFAGYIEYTNREIKKIVENILRQTKGNDIIIIQSDHGIIDIEPTRKKDAFRNFSAFYFPDNNYDMLYEGMSNVNTFRILLNKYFDQRLPLLKDESYFIK